jgi:hypothetical protein
MCCNIVSFHFFYGVVCSEIVQNCSPPASLVQCLILGRWFIPCFLFLFDSNLQSLGPAVAVQPLSGCSLVFCSSTVQVVGTLVAVCKFWDWALVIPHWRVGFHAIVSLLFLFLYLVFCTFKERFFSGRDFCVLLFSIPGNHASSYVSCQVLHIVP